MTCLRPYLTLPGCCLALLVACGDDANPISSDSLTTSTTLPTNNPTTDEPPTTTQNPSSTGTTDGSATVATLTQGTTDPTLTGPTTSPITITETTDPSATQTDPSGTTVGTTTTTDPSGTTTTTDPSGTTTTGDTTTGDTTTGGPPPFVGIPETCAQAELSKSTVGCLFYAVDMDSHDLAETLQYAVGIANVQLDKPANITIERKQGNVWNVVAGPAQISQLNLGTYNLMDNHTDDSELKAGLAYRVTSDVPVIAYQFNPIDGQSSFLSDAAMLYPVTAWDHINHAITYTGTTDNTNTAQHSYATAVAWKDNTKITITPSVATDGGNGVPAGQPGVPFDVILNEGDGVSVAIQNLNSSLSGTTFESDPDHPFGLFAGLECALIPAAGQTCCCDHMEEQISGVRLWGKNFIASRMPVRRPATPEPTLWQIYGAEDNTVVNLVADPQVTGLPPNPIMLNKGQVVEFLASGPTAEPGDFEVNADKPVAVMMYMVGSQYNGPEMPGDPASVQFAAFEQFLPRYVVLVPGTWINDIGVFVRQAGAVITIDGVAIPDNNFNPVGNSGFEVARVSLGDGVHVLDGAGDAFSVVVVGFDQYDSYAYLGGTGTAIINPDPQ